MENTTAVVIALIGAIAGPILAVQAQAAVEISRAYRGRKNWVFETLMATRRARLSPDHVRALNMIDLAFYGRRRWFRLGGRAASETRVLNKWTELLDHLATPPTQAEGAGLIWDEKYKSDFVDLMEAIAADTGFEFDRVQFGKGAYSPQAHGDIENQLSSIRELTIAVLSGKTPLKMDVESFPGPDANFIAGQIDAQSKLAAALDGAGALTVKLVRTQKSECP